MIARRRVLLGAITVAVGVAALGVAPTNGMAARASGAPEAAAALPAVYEHPGRILAGNCFQCHGTNGQNGPWDTLTGDSADDLYHKLKEFQGKSWNGEGGIMAVHAQSYTDEQLRLIADYFAHAPKAGG